MAVTAHHKATIAPALKLVGGRERPREQAIGRALQARRRLEEVSAARAPAAGPDRFAHLRRSHD